MTSLDTLYFAFDTWQGQWSLANVEGFQKVKKVFSGQPTSPLSLGIHTLYAYAADGQDATSINTGLGTSPIDSNIRAYVFLVY